jgi:phosphatidate cytidylyltransferase
LNNLIRRTITGALIVIFVLGGFWLHPYSFFIIGFILTAGTQYEYHIMVKTSETSTQLIPGIILGLIMYTLSTLVASGVLAIYWFVLLIPFMTVIMITELYRKQEKPFDSLAHTFFSVLYIALPFSLFPFAAYSRSGLDSILNHDGISFSPGIIIGFFILTWAFDTGAYLIGISIGKHRIMERISPKKSWEGFFGGMIIAVLAAWFLSGWFGVIGRQGWLIVALIISITGTYGDLAESMLKRSLGVKDSGSVMPGHGGFLDRFDSVLLSFPLVYLYIILFG